MDSQQILDEKIDNFWRWFFTAEEQIKRFFSDIPTVNKDQLIEEINNHVLDFGMFSWEIGPLENYRFYLAISPNGNRENLQISKQIIASAPDLEEWDWHPAKPAKDWDMQLNIFDEFMLERTIDCSNWNALLAKSPENRLVIILEAPNVETLDLDTQSRAGEIVVINLIGEEAKMNFIERVEVKHNLAAEEEEKRFPVGELKSILGL